MIKPKKPLLLVDNNTNVNDEFNDFYFNESDSNINYTIKQISTDWNFIVKNCLDLGTQFFGITINLQYDYDNDFKYVYNLSDKHYISIKDTIYSNFPTTIIFFIVSEKTKKNKLHYHTIVGIKNFIDYNYCIKNSLCNLLIDDSISIDVRVDSLLFFKDIKNWIMYMHKDIFTWKYSGYIWCLYIYSVDWFFTQDKNRYGLGDIYSCICTFVRGDEKFIEYNQDIVWIGLLDQLKIEKFVGSSVAVNGSDFVEDYKRSLGILDKISGIRLLHNKINQRLLVNLLQYYIILNDYYIFNNNVYKKIPTTHISYELVGNIIDILYKEFHKNVVSYFLTNFNYYFDSFDFGYLMDTYFIKTKIIIENLKDIITNNIFLDFGFVEFNDGIYYFKQNKFIKKDQIIGSKYENIATIKYYNKSYSRLRHKYPSTWLNGIGNALGITNLSTLLPENINSSLLVLDTDLNKKYLEFINICKSIANIFQNQGNKKKSTLFVFGISNTGKTTLIVNPLKNYFGLDNIGYIISSSNFKYQDCANKYVIIIDEGHYKSSMAGDILKLTGGEILLTDKKYSKDHITIKPTAVFVCSNDKFKDKDFNKNLSLTNRNLYVEFLYQHKYDPYINNKLFLEEVDIMVFCNKILFGLNNVDKNNISKDINKIN